jgi:hypothetical protein
MGVRDVSEPVSDPPELDVRELGGDHLDVIAQLEAANASHHNSSPIFVPYPRRTVRTTAPAPRLCSKTH